MPLLSVVTAALAPTPAHVGFLLEAYESLTNQVDLGGWEWEWLVQEDGDRPRLREHLPADERIRYAAQGRQFGAAVTRSVALERARGPVVRVLDADDVLLPRGLAAPLELLTEHPQAGWALGERWQLLMPQAHVNRVVGTTLVQAGLLRRNLVADLFRETGEIQVHCAGLTIRTDILRAFGGWAASPRSEDVILLAAVNMFYPGAYTPEPSFLYRLWPDQVTRQQWWTGIGPVAHSMLWQRLAAIRAVMPELRPAAHDSVD